MKALFFGANHKAAQFNFGGSKVPITPTATRQYFTELKNALRVGRVFEDIRQYADIMVASPSACLESARHELGAFDGYITKVVKLGVQDPWHVVGAYTGATTYEMAADPLIGAEYAVIAHSEVREGLRIFKAAVAGHFDLNSPVIEKIWPSIIGRVVEEMDLSGKPRSFRLAADAIAARQVARALEMNMTPILCVGETLQEREAGQTMDVVSSQLNWGLYGLTPGDVSKTIIAYEPVWAIGTGVTATPDEAQEVHAGINGWLNERTGTVRHHIKKIYGGSMNAKNVAELVNQPDIDGGLIGGAGTDPAGLVQLVSNGVNAVT